ncbi:MAG: trypsin-like serine protease [Deltaproteobacteria bacterium]|nr:trypsin-like serine protease [Deltaproteobacteria bacterium]MBI3295540.1 trypsin-like serine protease [Deltaproteobacteria bacterium]
MKRNVGSFLIGVVILALALLSACGNLSSSLSDPSRIQANMTSGYTPVVMVIEPGGTGICSGTIVSPTAVLTAAHCTKVSGTYTIQGDFGQGTFSATTTTTESFGPGTVGDTNDIAVLIFSSPITTSGSANIYDIGSTVSNGQSLDLVGYGCNDINTKSGAGVKRAGSNQVAQIDDFLFFLTPISSSSVATSTQRILGPSNRVASCFGDSGGPALAAKGSSYNVVGVTHAGGVTSSEYVSEYIDLTRSDNRGFLSGVNSAHSLSISGL